MALLITERKASLPNAENENIFTSRVSETISEKDIEKIMAESNTTLTSADIAACMSLYRTVIQKALCNGCRVELPFVDLYFSAYGTDNNHTHKFTPQSTNSCNHRIELHAAINKKETKTIQDKVKYKRAKYGLNTADPFIKKVSIIAENLLIEGRALSFDCTDNKAGVFIYTDSKQNFHKEYRAESYLLIEGTKVIVKIPDNLADGAYCIKLVKQQGKTYKTSDSFPVYTLYKKAGILSINS